jgi:peptidyl-dipeptidase A
MQELWPLYRELHTWTRYELAARYSQPVPDSLPAHWLPNRWGQSWASIVDVQGLDVDGALKDKPPAWITQEAEAFYVSLGFPGLPPSFWEKSSLYPVPPDAGYKKNTHASAWHVDLNQDVRSLMSVESNSEWFQTANHELGHIYYYMSYTRPDVPPLLRKGANRAFHEAVGTQMGMAAMQRPFLVGRGLVPADVAVDQNRVLLKEALESVVFMPFSVGTMTGFERDLYRANLPPEKWNARWWQLAAHYQGMTPPSPRGEEFADALTKTHINDDAAQYYDYALSYVILFQLHDHISKNILQQDPRATNYWGSRETGDFLRKVLEPGGTRDWRALLREATGEEISARAMLAYYEPLMSWLREQNQGRVYTLPETLAAPPTP